MEKIYTLKCEHGERMIKATYKQAVMAAIEMERELKPNWGVEVFEGNTYVCLVVDGRVD